ncbi:recombinase family protein [Paeniroseomonas aquatica]|uniref:Recombinase family protein n=1 Tax=Paeniroseomonas aquatica TaxID=373043 RepID=A0ABT8AFY2_9PROT|nr:recombinase family protein [Paeniroseomonas aquatica]MDN3568662.1 recombinase family protein [Paeniroseomonas aquatica]
MPITAARAALNTTRKARTAAAAAAIIKVIIEARAAGVTTSADISNYLNRHGFRTPLNCRWTPNTVRLLLKKVSQSEAKTD